MLEVLGLSKRYGGVVALDDAGFTVRPGRITGFLGPNGAGKTTAMRAIFGLVTPDRGDISWQGSPVGPAERIRFGYMPEQRGLYPRMQVGRQLNYFARLHGIDRETGRAAVQQWLERLGLAGRADSLVEALSHGNQQRVQLAAALVHNPNLIVLDEPFSGLDPLAVTTMSAVLRELASEGAAVLLSSHQLDLVDDVCEDVVIVNRGRIVLTGAIHDLRQAHPHRILEVGFAGAAAEWHTGLEGVRLLESRNGWARYLVPREADPQTLMAAAGRGGEISHFAFGAPPLTEIFVDAVGSSKAQESSL